MAFFGRDTSIFIDMTFGKRGVFIANIKLGMAVFSKPNPWYEMA